MDQKGDLEEKKQYSPVTEIRVVTIMRLVGETTKPNKIRRMAKMIMDPQIEHHVLEIPNPSVHKSEQEIIEREFNISKFDMGPSMTEGDICWYKTMDVIHILVLNLETQVPN